MLRFLPGTVPDYNFSVDVVEVMHDGSRMMSKEVSAVIYSYLCMYICVTFISVICFIPHADCCEIVVCWIKVISVI
jgi:hypothetical protein